MKLLYVWIKKFGNIENLEFNFSSDYKLTYSSEENHLSIEKSKHFVPNLFGSNISDLKVIVGENGTGKSNLLDFITNWIGNFHIPAIVAFDRAVLVSDSLKKGFKIRGEIIEKIYFGMDTLRHNDERPYETTGVIYYSSFYDRRRDWHSGYAVNISTNHLIINDKQHYRKNSTKITEIHSNKISDVKRQINFIESKIIPKLPFNYPDYVGGYFKSQFNDSIERLAWVEIEKTAYGREINALQVAISQSYSDNFGYLEAINYPLFVFLVKGVLIEKYIFSRIINKSAGEGNEINIPSEFNDLFNSSEIKKAAPNLLSYHDEMLKILVAKDQSNELLKTISEFFKFINEELKDTGRNYKNKYSTDSFKTTAVCYAYNGI